MFEGPLKLPSAAKSLADNSADNSEISHREGGCQASSENLETPCFHCQPEPSYGLGSLISTWWCSRISPVAWSTPTSASW